MSEYKEYTVRVYKNSTQYLNSKEEFHREDGPALECYDGRKFYFYQGINLDFVKNDQQLKSYIKMKAFL